MYLCYFAPRTLLAENAVLALASLINRRTELRLVRSIERDWIFTARGHA